MPNEEFLHQLLDKVLETLSSNDLPPRQRERLESVEERIYQCFKSDSLSAAEIWKITLPLIDYLEPPNTE